ncbi:LytTR family DNA-binding domain-containing protein [Terrimonas sp. NA20]|uniref:LytTR family DNA-binding domain-containing protein n=1 Tax=Terrimonas ginsenosidimutans TaxID=2908004 RepID=A0ABS9KU13_9BACT|nr:LytTR family DNA-binding domain-containing protein [Terrimonas ginsenosidimutans]MCG2615832.1 LytTR family DNA-binding domain-containing protein [Terrimonas ginsenosidimutans]
MSIRYILIDDELNNIENLSFMLTQNCPSLERVGSAGSGEEGRRLIQNTQPDLVFLDIQMPGVNGFDMLRSLASVNFEVIFVTAYDQYGIQAIKFSALDYLLKPIDVEDLKKAVNKAIQKIEAKQQNTNISNLLKYLQTPKQESPRIALPTLQETHYVKLEDIVRCEASDNYTAFFLSGGDKILVSRTLKEYADLLKPHHFIRTHQSHLVNSKFIKSLLKEDGGNLLLLDKTRVPISRQYLDPVKKSLNNIIHP